MAYDRPVGAAQSDFKAAREFEETVGSWIGEFRISNLDSPNRLDHWVPGLFIECKEKRQPLSAKWTKLWPAVPETDLFIVDELSVRRAMQHSYAAYFLLRDVPNSRVFWARLDELCSVERVRVDRQSSNGHRKGKWLIDLRHFRVLENGHDLMPLLLADQIAAPWKSSGCLSVLEVPTV